MLYNELVDKVSNKLNISREIVDSTYKSYWKFIKDSILSLPLKQDLNQDLFNELNTSFNIPSIGKIAVTWSRYIGVKQRFNHLKSLKENNNEYKKY